MQHQLSFTQNLSINPASQISPQLAGQMGTLWLKPEDDLRQRKKLITFYLNWINLIISQGEYEHTGDWDPALTVQPMAGPALGNEAGFYIAKIDGDNLLLEHPNEDGESPDEDDEDCYHIIPIMEISAIHLYFH